MEESLFHCTEQAGILSSIKSSASPVGFCKTELLLELQEVSKDRTLFRSSSSASLSLASNLVWIKYADFSLIFFPLLTQTNVSFCYFVFKTVNLL